MMNKKTIISLGVVLSNFVFTNCEAYTTNMELNIPYQNKRIETSNVNVYTSNGIHIGSLVNDVIKKYGEVISGNKYLKGEGNVENIGAIIPDEFTYLLTYPSIDMKHTIAFLINKEDNKVIKIIRY